MKTGYTEKAGRTLVSAAQRSGMTLIAVTLNDPNDWKDHTALFDWGFSKYAMVNVTQQNVSFGRLPVSGSLNSFVSAISAEALSYPIKADDRPELRLKWNHENLCAPVEQGSVLGFLCMSCNGELVAEIPLVAAKTVYADLAADENLMERILHGIF